jgi:hypothetical protein
VTEQYRPSRKLVHAICGARLKPREGRGWVELLLLHELGPAPLPSRAHISIPDSTKDLIAHIAAVEHGLVDQGSAVGRSGEGRGGARGRKVELSGERRGFREGRLRGGCGLGLGLHEVRNAHHTSSIRLALESPVGVLRCGEGSIMGDGRRDPRSRCSGRGGREMNHAQRLDSSKRAHQPPQIVLRSKQQRGQVSEQDRARWRHTKSW